MSARWVDPVWGDDLMKIADAVGVVRPTGRPHRTPGDPSDLVLAIALETWAIDFPDAPIPLVPTDGPTDRDGTYDPEQRGEWR